MRTLQDLFITIKTGSPADANNAWCELDTIYITPLLPRFHKHHPKANHDDVAQDIRLAILEQIHSYEVAELSQPDTKYAAWLANWMRNESINRRKLDNRKKSRPERNALNIFGPDQDYTADYLHPPSHEPEPPKQCALQEQVTILHQLMLDLLSANEFATLIALSFEQLSVTETAIKLKQTPKQIDNTVARARRKLSHRMTNFISISTTPTGITRSKHCRSWKLEIDSKHIGSYPTLGLAIESRNKAIVEQCRNESPKT